MLSANARTQPRESGVRPAEPIWTGSNLSQSPGGHRQIGTTPSRGGSPWVAQSARRWRSKSDEAAATPPIQGYRASLPTHGLGNGGQPMRLSAVAALAKRIGVGEPVAIVDRAAVDHNWAG
jgi:hypothetical protein